MTVTGDRKIGIWGPTRSGKTTYLGALYLELQKEWNIINLSSVGRDSGQLSTGIANALSSGRFPPATPRESKHYTFFFHPNHTNPMKRMMKKRFELSLIEAPGNFIVKDRGLRSDDEISKYYIHLSECSGLILMIDPDTQGKNAEDMFGIEDGTYFLALQKLFQVLDADSNGKIFTKLAICLTKIDMDTCRRRLASDLLENLVYEIIGEDARNLIESKCIVRGRHSRVKFFGVSSVGTYKIDDRERPNVRPLPRQNQLEIAKPHVRRPIGLTSPITWLLK